MDDLSERKFASIDEKDTTEREINRATALYIKKVFSTVPFREDKSDFSSDKHTQEFILYENPTLDSVEFFILDKTNIGYSRKLESAYGMHVYFRGDVPENIIEYIDNTGVQHVKKLSVRFRFTELGDADSFPEFYNIEKGKRYDSYDPRDMSKRQREIAQMHVDVNSDEARERMKVFDQKPGDHPDMPNGGQIVLVRQSVHWYEYASKALEQLHQEYPDQFPDPNAFFSSLIPDDSKTTE